jgi:hypothetical protein
LSIPLLGDKPHFMQTDTNSSIAPTKNQEQGTKNSRTRLT